MADIVRRLREPPFGTETSERLLMAAAADHIESLRDELANAYEELIDHNGDDMLDTRRNRVTALRHPRSTMPRRELNIALRTLSEAAHAAIEAGKDTTEYPMLDRQKLRQIAALTDEMVRQPMVED